MRDRIGVDIGFGYTKSTGAGGGKRFPTAVSLMTAEATFSQLAPVLVNGKKYLVGEEAEREGGSLETRTSEFVGSDAWLAILGHALDATGSRAARSFSAFLRGSTAGNTPN